MTVAYGLGLYLHVVSYSVMTTFDGEFLRLRFELKDVHTYRKWDLRILSQALRWHLECLRYQTLGELFVSDSATRAYSNIECGHPCLTPLFYLDRFSEVSIYTYRYWWRVKVFTYLMKVSGIPIFSITRNMKSQSTLSKAFPWSSDIIYSGLFCEWL